MLPLPHQAGSIPGQAGKNSFALYLSATLVQNTTCFYRSLACQEWLCPWRLSREGRQTFRAGSRAGHEARLGDQDCFRNPGAGGRGGGGEAQPTGTVARGFPLPGGHWWTLSFLPGSKCIPNVRPHSRALSAGGVSARPCYVHLWGDCHVSGGFCLLASFNDCIGLYEGARHPEASGTGREAWAGSGRARGAATAFLGLVGLGSLSCFCGQPSAMTPCPAASLLAVSGTSLFCQIPLLQDLVFRRHPVA